MSTELSDKPPRWLVPVFSFIAGVAVTAGILLPGQMTDQQQRWKQEGFREGYAAADAGWEATVREAHEEGRRLGMKERGSH